MSRMPGAGDVIDGVFRIQEVIDEGSFGAIYRVHENTEDRTLALKVQKPGGQDPDEIKARFEREARLIYSLDHENVVEILYYGEIDEELPYMAMEFLVGTNLERLIRSGYELEDDQIKRIALETLSALDAAHERGIVHRDMKPGNIFLVDDGKRGHVKVLDFGFAKPIHDDRALTKHGAVVGSPAYMAPEMVTKEDVGGHSDLYGFGMVLGEMIAGVPVIKLRNPIKTVKFQGSSKPVELPEAVERSPFREIVQKAVQKDLDHRYRSASSMIEDLRALDLDDASADLQRHAEIERSMTVPFGESALLEVPSSDSDSGGEPGFRAADASDRRASDAGGSAPDEGSFSDEQAEADWFVTSVLVGLLVGLVGVAVLLLVFT